ncbi:MAG TPA: glycosyltransferase [Nitrososphaera sp.]|nr:glycosyltransferase [Nitrososphaera sp.]
MRILHLSDYGLPDWRIEKSAISASNLGHEVMFAGMRLNNYNGEAFSKVYEVSWTERARRGFPFYWQSVKRQVGRVLGDAKPDIVHAHNVFAARMISEFGLPFVYDNHEYWSVYVRRQAESVRATSQAITGGIVRRTARRLARYLLMRRAIYLWSKWERKLVSTTPTITVSDRIAAELKATGSADKVFVVPNFPLMEEVKDFERPRYHTTLSSVYAGLEAQGTIKPAHRNIDGLTDVFNDHNIGYLCIIGSKGESSKGVDYKGFLPRQEMYREMFSHSIGLVPMKKHWSHVYISPNKAYEYAHAGLFVMCTSSFETVSAILRENCATFQDYADMASQLEYFKDNMDELYKKRLKIFEFARNHLIWERYQNNIFRAYQTC